MNTLNELVQYEDINIYTAQQMINNYKKRIGEVHGVNEIVDINYNRDTKSRDITLRCTKCNREIVRSIKCGKTKWNELPKTCNCVKDAERKARFEKSQKIKKDLLDKINSRVGKTYGDYTISKVVGEDILSYEMVCNECGDIRYFNAKRFASYCRPHCTKHFQAIKFDESYIGRKNNYLTVIGIVRNKYNNRVFLCKCDCGNVKEVIPNFWESGRVKSCGCKHDALCRNANKKENSKIHRRLYHIWSGMKQRCYNPKSTSYPNYGGRGIRICDEWLNSYESFEWWSIMNGYADDLSIDRINVNGNYEPSNCRWADWETQASNRRPSWQWNEPKGLVEFDGKTRIMKDIYAEYGASEQFVRYRMEKLGMTFEQAVKTPKMAMGRPKKEVANG